MATLMDNQRGALLTPVDAVAFQTAVLMTKNTNTFWYLIATAVVVIVGVAVLLSSLKLRSSDDATSPRNRRHSPSRVATKKTGLRYAVLGNGLLGSHIVEALLARGEENVVAFDYDERSLFAGDNRVITMRGDVRKIEDVRKAVRGCHTVIDTIARIALLRSEFDYRISHSINCRGTDCVIEACRLEAVHILLYTSSVEVIKNAGIPFSGPEDAPYTADPLTNYAKTKAVAEKAVLAANGVDGLRTVAMRLNSIWGPRDNYFITRTATSGPILLSAAPQNALRDWCYVENCAHAFLKCEETMLASNPSAADGRAFFICDNRPLSVGQFYDITGAAFKKWVVTIPYPVLRIAGWLTDLALLVSPGCNTGETSTLGQEVMDEVIWCKDPKQARETFGYEELYTIEEGIEASVRFHESLRESQ